MSDLAGAMKRNDSRAFAKTAKEADELYTKTIETYDDDIMNQLRIDTLKDSLVKKTIANIKNDESAVLLDLAAGTGIIAERLRIYGFRGIMDALERNIAMLERAKAKGMYRKYMSFDITPFEPLPVEDGTYDAITMAGALTPNQVQPGSIKQAVRCLKPGGVISFYVRKPEEWNEFVEELDRVVNHLLESGVLSLIEVNEVPQFDTVITNDIVNKVKLYVYRKL